MADLREHIFSLLSNDAALTPLVGTRVYPIHLPQNVTLPAISYSRISGGQQNTTSGYNGLENPRYQIDVWALTYDSARDLMGKVRDAMDGASAFKALMWTDQDFYEDDTFIFRVSMDFSIWHNI